MNNALVDFLESMDSSSISDSLCWQCLNSPWGDRFEHLQLDADPKLFLDLIDALHIMQRSKDYSIVDEFTNEAKRVAAICLSLVKNNGFSNGTYIAQV